MVGLQGHHQGQQFREPRHLTLTTDASLSGWGAHLRPHMAQGQWTQEDLSHNINWLLLRAIYLALRNMVAGKDILISTDNVASKDHINRLEGTCSRPLMEEAKHLGLWAEAHLLSIRAVHILGVGNIQADWLSRASVNHTEWHLHPSLF